MRKYLYLCYFCRKHIKDVNKGFIVEEVTKKIFCSEKCTVSHFSPYIDFYYDQETEQRKILNCLEMIEVSQEAQQEMVQGAVEAADEVWENKDQLGVAYYHLIKKNHQNAPYLYTIVIAHFFGGKPSFVIHHILTSSPQLVQSYRLGMRIDKNSQTMSDLEEGSISSEQVIIPQNVLDDIEQLRSTYLADMIQVRTKDDIPMERFALYENYIEPTISQPEEVFEFKDRSGYLINAFIKDFTMNNSSFFYIVLSLKLDPKHKEKKLSEDDVLVPIIAFPTVKMDLYHNYKRGQCLTKKALN